MSNGSQCEFVGLAGLLQSDSAKIAAAGPGEVVNLEQRPTHVLVKVPALQTSDHIPRIVVDGQECVPLELSVGEIEVGRTKLSFSSHHVTLAFAVTMHKVQGKTLEKAIICLANHDKRWKPSFEQLLVAITRVRHADDLRFFPSLCASDRNFYSLRDLSPNADVTKWFDGEFDPLGFRFYEETTEKLQKKQSSATKKSAPEQLQPLHTKFQKTEQPNVHTTITVVEPPHPQTQTAAHQTATAEIEPQAQTEEIPAQEWNDILALWGGARPFHQIAQYIHDNNTIWEVETIGQFIDHPVIDAVLGAVANPLIPYEMRESPWTAPTFVTLFKMSSHFVPMKVELQTIPPTFTIRDSCVNYTNCHQTEKQREIAAVEAKIRALTLREDVFFFEEPVQQQTENDCAVHTINNSLQWMLPEDKQVLFTRATLGKLLRTFL